MQVFRAALKAFFRHPVYLLIYVVLLSCMGVFMGMSIDDAPSDEYLKRPRVAVVDRDKQGLSQGLRAFVLGQGEAVEVEDTERALQDAVMQELASYIVVIPEGFSADFARTATTGTKMPEVQTITSTQSAEVTMMDGLVDEYLGVARTYTLALANTDQSQVVERTNAAMAHTASVNVVQTSEAAPLSNAFLVYLQFEGYTILLSIAVCSAVVISRFGREEMHRRVAASPVPQLRVNLQIAAACLVIMLACWAFVCGLGIVAFGGRIAGVAASHIAAALASLMCYSLFALAFGFLVGQTTGNELVMNAVSNIAGLVISFLGGVWISLDLVGEPIVTIAKFTPVYYYNEALRAALDPAGGGFAPEALASMGIVCLFALVVFCVGLAISGMRVGRMGVWNGSSTKRLSHPAA